MDAPLAHAGRHRLPGSRRVPAGDGPPDHPRADQEDEGAGRGRPPASARPTARGRDRRLYPTVAIVGYTNAGKSTLLNALVGSEVAKAEDKLFATLDPTSRQVKLGDGQTAIVTDTVGFIHKLPHQLVDAFRATLEEVTRADVLVEVVDASDGHAPEHRATVQTVLDELGAGDKPRLAAFNKADLLYPGADGSTAGAGGRRARCSCRRRRASGSTRCGPRSPRCSRRCGRTSTSRCPYAAGELLARVRERGTVDLEYRERDVRVTGRMAPGLAGRAARRRGALGGDARRRGRGVLSDAVGRRVRPASRHRAARRPGDRVWWSVAEGRRGRRWREAIVGDGGPAALAAARDGARTGSFSHLELATPAGLLTLHPEGDGTLHGNAIEAGGIRHVAGLAVGRAGRRRHRGVGDRGRGVRARSLAGEVEPGESARRTVLRITAGLLITTGPGTGRAHRRRDVADRRRRCRSGWTPTGLPVAARRRGLAARTGGAGEPIPGKPRHRGPVRGRAVDKIVPRAEPNSQTRG